MAEILKEIQERDLHEYETIKLRGICSSDELNELIQKRERLEKKIIQSKKNLVDYIQYIEFERNTHKWLTEKEEQHHCNLTSVKASIIQRIVRLYRSGAQQFPQEERLWNAFIKFSKKSNRGQVSGIYEKMLGYHGDKDTVWCDYVLWAYESTKQIKQVKEIFFRALKRIPSSEILNLAFFDVIIKETVRITNIGNAISLTERQLGLERAMLLYRSSRSTITNVDYYLKLLEKCEDPKNMNCTALLQKEIIGDIMKNFSTDAVMWDYLAQRELKGYSQIYLEEITPEKMALLQEKLMQATESESALINESIWKVHSLKLRIELCFKVYEKAVESVPTETMWSYFINAMLELNKDIRMEGDLKRYYLAKAFNMGHKSKLMSVVHYRACVKMLLMENAAIGINQVEKLLQEALAFKKSEKLYELLMQAYIEADNEPKFIHTFYLANKELGSVKCIALWHLAINFYKEYYEEHLKKLSVLLEEAAKQIYPEFAEFRAYYVEFTAQTESLKKARELYDELCQCPPPCLELHQKMAEIEKAVSTPKSDKSRLRKCYENAVFYFGKSNIAVWVDLLKFERDFGNMKLLSVIYDRAKTTMNSELVESFVGEYSLLNAM